MAYLCIVTRLYWRYEPTEEQKDGNLGVRRSMRDVPRSVIGVHRSATLAGVHFEALGERMRRNEPLLSPKTMAGWASQEEVLRRSWLDFEALTILLL